jgi:single-strand DNA-binding protein
MADLNKVFLMGRLTFDPELRRTPSGTAVAELRLATKRSWPGRDGERREETLFIDVTVWDRQAETCCEFLRKGSAIHVEGSLRMDTWDDKTTGEKRSKIRVQADRVQFLDTRRGEGAGGADDEYGSATPPAREAGPRRAATQARGPAGYVEPRAPGNGPGRGAELSAPEPVDHGTPDRGDNADIEDIPF